MPTDSPLISIIIVNHNGINWLRPLLDSIFSQAYRNFEVLLVDNTSTDSSLEFVATKYNRVRIIDPNKNLGFGRAANLGASMARGNFFIFLNEDMKLGPQMLQILVTEYQHRNQHRLAILAPQEVDYNDPGIVHNQGWRMDFWGYTSPLTDTTRAMWGKFFYAPGAPCFIKREAFEYVGGFESNYFLYYEDVDLSWKLRLTGFQIAVTDATYVHHHGSGTTAPYVTKQMTMQNCLYTRWKNFSGLTLAWLEPLMLVQGLIVNIYLSLRLLSMTPVLNFFRSYLYLVRSSILLKRRRQFIQHLRTVPESDILHLLSPYFFGPYPFSLINIVLRPLIRAYVQA